MQRPLKIVFAGGGTGGHLFPGIAVAEELIARDATCRMLFAGSNRAIEQTILAAHDYEHCSLPVESSASFFQAPHRVALNLWLSYRAAHRLLKRESPACVVGLGGYASVPIGLAARRLRIPLVLLEQNIVPGRATSLLSRLAMSACFSFPGTTGRAAGRSNACVTGNPVRRAVANLFNLPHEPSGRTLLVLGGSQGAIAVNDAVLGAVDELAPLRSEWRIVHQTGNEDAQRVRRAYDLMHVDAIVEPFFDDIVKRLSSATIVVSRAGATTLAELACVGCPTVLIPYPDSIGDHQRANARMFAGAGAARTVEQSAGNLGRELQSLMNDPKLRQSMSDGMRTLARPEASRLVADCILQIATTRAT